jgi:hypothetical protein
VTRWIWMKHETHGGVTRFPAESREGWQGRGWAECPEPEDVDDRVAVQPPEETPLSLESGQEKGKVKRNG